MRKALKELPKTLDETYERILLNIPEEYFPDAQVIFALLAYGSRSVSVAEVAEAIAINLEEASFDARDRLADPCGVLKICSSLLTLSPFQVQTMNWGYAVLGVAEKIETLRFAHYSVKEYLISQRWSSTISHLFKLDIDSGHDLIAQLCLSYLLSIRDALQPTLDTFRSLPLLQYATRFWHVHYNATHLGDNEKTRDMALRLFQKGNETSLRNALTAVGRREVTPLYYASQFGLVDICQHILASGVDVDAHGGGYRNALQVAALYGHEVIVRLLIDNGADVNTRGGAVRGRSALQYAATNGHCAIVRLLLSKGANIDAKARSDVAIANALQGAIFGKHAPIVSLLLENHVDVNAQGGAYGNALQVAACTGSEELVRLLIENGALVNAQGGHFGNALQAAIQTRKYGIVRLLIENGANVNAQGGKYGNPLRAACIQRDEYLVRLLLKNGAQVKDHGLDIQDNMLEAAIIEGEDAIVKVLMEAAKEEFGNTHYSV